MISYPHETPPAPGEFIDVAPGVKWIRMPLPFALKHINLWLLEDGEGWAIIDTGYGVAATWALWEQHFVQKFIPPPRRQGIKRAGKHAGMQR